MSESTIQCVCGLCTMKFLTITYFRFILRAISLMESVEKCFSLGYAVKKICLK